ncbi:MAG TPA: serine/threonine-protein kinase [Polyangiaceae bacterium]|nr:serine/threonine-protein kinase [Polyangiaceae bacterium]
MSAAVDSGSLVGQTIGGKFLVDAYVGGGAMGEVYRATHVDLGRTIALKVMRSDLSDATFAMRFQREAKAASLLDHPNTVRVLDFGTEASGLAYIAMEFLDGMDLYQLIKAEHPLPDGRIVSLLGQALSAMKAAHRLGIIHRDIKPENIMVVETHDDDGGELREVVKVCDFGIAKITEREGMQTEPGRALTGMGTLMGTPEYMSPEQSRGEPLDARSDLYSMGIVLFQMLTGRVPFTGDTPLGVVVKQVTDPPPRPSSIRPEVDPRLEEICLRALEKRPEDRFQSAGEMRAALLGVVDPSQSLPLTRAATESSRGVSSGTLHASSAASSAASSPASSPDGDLGTRATVPHTSPVVVEGPPKRKPRSRALVLLLVLLGGLLVGGGLFLVPRVLGEGPTAPVASASASTSASATASVLASSIAEPPSAAPPTSAPTSAPPPTASASPPGPTSAPTNATKPTPSHVAAAASAKPTPSTSAPPASASTPPPEAPEAPINTERAFVRLGAVSAGATVQPLVASFMTRALPSLSGCYRNALRAANKPAGGPLTVALSIDERGNILYAASVGAATRVLTGLPGCFQGALANRNIGHVDATTTADVQLTLVPQ